LTVVVSAPHVATVAGRPISIERLAERVAAVRRGPRGRHLPPPGAVEDVRLQRWVVQELVTEDILVHEAQAAGIIGGRDGPERDDSQPRTVSPTELSLLVARVTADATISPRDVRGYYVRNGDLYRRPASRRVRHVLVADESAGEGVVTRIAAGEAMPALAMELSIDAGTRTKGGDLGDLHRGEFSGPLEDALFGAEIGSVVGPIRTEHGWHVARVEAVTPAAVVRYADARPAIEAELQDAARTTAFAAWVERRRAILAVIEPAFEHPAHPVHGLPSHRH
jgi:[acyl-carrier-protein] S-malonyltransferase